MNWKNKTLLWRLLLVFILYGVLPLNECYMQPEKRMFQHFDQYNYMKMAQENELRNILQQSVESLRARERRGHQLVADSGYGSRVGAGANFAIAQMARNGIFSIHGPGRKKRSYHDNVNDILRS